MNPITVVEAASSTLLTTPEAVRRELNVDVDQDPLLHDLIRQASDAIANHTNRVFAREKVTEILPGYGDNDLQLSRFPIVEVDLDGDTDQVAIVRESTTITDFIIKDAEAGVLYRRDGWDWTATYIGWHQGVELIGSVPQPGSEEPQFAVTYWGGFILPSFDKGEVTLPGDVERACINAVKAWYNARSGKQPNVKSKKIGDTTITYADRAKAEAGILPLDVREMLDTYRLVLV